MENKIEYKIFDGRTIEKIAQYCEELHGQGWRVVQVMQIPVSASQIASQMKGIKITVPGFDPHAMVMMFFPFCRKNKTAG